MALKKKNTPKRWRSKEAREIAKAVARAGGSVERTGKGHLKITGPKGTAIIASAPDTGRQGGRALANTWATITDKTGLAFPPAGAHESAPGPGAPGTSARPDNSHPGRAAARPDVPASAAPARSRRYGTVTRWKPGETYGFVTGHDGSSWFVSCDSLPGGHTELPEGTAVTFSGSPSPKPGKGYPQAHAVLLAED